MSIHFGSALGVHESFSESGAPLFVQAGMSVGRVWSQKSLFSITSKESRSGNIEPSLVTMETSTLESLVCLLELVFLIKTSSCDLGIHSTEL